MARIYARRRGRSGSKPPLRKKPPEWLQITPEEIEERIIELYKQGYSTSVIGMVLRDCYGVPDVRLVTGKKMTQILREYNVASKVPEDLQNLIKKAIRLRKHLELHRKDLHNKRALQLTESKIRRLVKYYKRKKVLPADWEYKPETAEILLRA
ncbi:30S ribosomal protein S15 [Candidatus Alkanophaga liquidiphilum]|nr:Ribosomal protein S15P/S13E [Candidatus Alkanophaga liquidiphilum]RLG38923.1 MAG: 30S ribosomal protein S15 [Candidatus Alkanophagales archaeon]